jgi:hypothetical protein
MPAKKAKLRKGRGNYRPICDTWIMGRSRTKYYGAFPAGFLQRARHLIGVPLIEPVLFVCGGMVRDYSCRGFGPNDKTLDLDPALSPDFLADAREPYPLNTQDLYGYWPGIIIDRPYTEEDADRYAPGRSKFPKLNLLVKHAINAIDVGSRIGILDYLWPQAPKNAKEQAVITVATGRNNRVRLFVVYEKIAP